MPVRVEKTDQFDRLPTYMKFIAATYAAGKTFEDLNSIFGQQDAHHVYVMSGFRPAEVNIVPQNLPEQITEVDIIASWSDDHNNIFDCRPLRAKYFA